MFAASSKRNTEMTYAHAVLQKVRTHARDAAMSNTDADKTPRTYRLSTKLVHDLKQFRDELRMRPTETSIVETAIREFMSREREAMGGKREARR